VVAVGSRGLILRLESRGLSLSNGRLIRVLRKLEPNTIVFHPIWMGPNHSFLALEFRFSDGEHGWSWDGIKYFSEHVFENEFSPNFHHNSNHAPKIVWMWTQYYVIKNTTACLDVKIQQHWWYAKQYTRNTGLDSDCRLHL